MPSAGAETLLGHIILQPLTTTAMPVNITSQRNHIAGGPKPNLALSLAHRVLAE
jgi:hypothetical protein